MKRTFFSLVISILYFTSCQDVNSLVADIAKEDRVECQSIGLAGGPSTLYSKFELLKKKASEKELLQLLNHSSLPVRVYTSYALIDRNLISPHLLLKPYIDSKDNVSTICGCIVSSSSVSRKIYHRYKNGLIEYPNEQDYRDFIINDSRELQIMDSLILYAKHPDEVLILSAFENRIYSNNYHKKIKELAFGKRNFYALRYVFQNLSIGNEESLKKGLNEFLESGKICSSDRIETNQMLRNLGE